MSELLNRFKDNSIKVGNQHEINNLVDFKNFLSNLNFNYINLPALQIFKEHPIPKEGIENAIVQAQYGIAETGTMVIESLNENLRMATCLCENLHIVLYVSDLVERLEDIAEYLQEETSADKSYVSFITGASRTADIERELTIGVHGPKTLTVHFIDDQSVTYET